MKAGVAGLGGPLALVLLLPMEAGVPIPVPADLVMFTVGERVAARCPACIGVSLLTGRVPGLAGLTAPDPVRLEPGDEPRVLVS
ncbi:MAG: hypothetical protein ACRDPF_21955 [Streptosporangiaceae bacterium]